MKPIYQTIFLILIYCSAASGQKLKYDVWLFGKKIGETHVELKDSAGVKYYSLHSNTRVKMLLMDKRFIINGHVVMGRDGLMYLSDYESIKENGTSRIRAIWDKEKLTVDKNGEKTVIKNAVQSPTIKLYFEEPQSAQTIYSERWGVLYQLKKEADGRYVGQVNNRSDKYTYTNGKLTQIELKNSMGSVYMTLSK